MPRLRHSLAVALLLATAATARAADEEGRFAVKGPGLAPCKNFTEEVVEKSQSFYATVGWLFGFISAYNMQHDGTYDAAAWQSSDLLVGLMNNYCKQRPDDRFAEGALKLVRLLSRSQITTESKLMMVENDGKKVLVYEEVMRRTQQALKDEGYYSGVIDGLFGPGTKKSLQTYQEANKLDVTGIPDARTLFSIFRSDLVPEKADQ